ncbi:BspA family leucine-rich repeat surface protein [Cyclobacteriaceae bacterium]|nr:BspA family leucine-rich repeat surface protein [Cyclobacteriaceae bacterium]
MKHLKHLLLLSILCSLVLFTNCDEDDAAADTPTNTTDDDSTTVLDADGDGVADADDTCADTPRSETVDSSGCSDSQKDSDGDGITDDVDTCADTAEGTTVDENGCEVVTTSFIYLDENGVTIKATEDAIIGEEYTLLGENYLIVDKEMLREMIVENEDVSKVVTTFITNMDDLFGGGEYFEPYNSEQLATLLHYEDTLNGVFGRYTGKYEYAAKNFDYDISGWDVSNVTSMVKMFAGMSTVNGDRHDFTNWDVSSVTTMKGLFKDSDIKGGNFSGWDITNVEDLSELFMNASYAGYYEGVSNWNTSNVKNMRRAIFGNFLDLQWNISAVENMSQMFKRSNGTTALQYLAEWDVSNVNNMSGMFQETGGFNTDIGNWDVSNVEDMSYMFKSSEQFSRDISDWDVSSVKNMREMFCKTEYKRSIANWNVINVIDCKDFSFRGDTISSSFVDNIYWKPNFTNCTE